MDKNHGYVKLYRSIMDWGWYRDSATFRLFVHCLLKANFVEKEWMGRKIPVGSFATSLGTLSKELGLSIDKIRTAIKHLKMSHEITYESTSRYSIITVNSFNRYQQTNPQNDKQIPNTSQTFTKHFPTTKERNKGIKEECNNSIKKIFQKLSLFQSKAEYNYLTNLYYTFVGAV